MRVISVAASLVLVWGLAACNAFGLPATRALEAGAQATLEASSFEMSGAYSVSGARWTIDVQLTKPDTAHISAAYGGQKVEAVIVGQSAYYRGKDFLAAHLSGNPLEPSLVAAAGNSWWKGPSYLPALTDFTNGSIFRSTFLGTSATSRTDNQTVSGVDAVELSGARADVYISSVAPYDLLRVHLKQGVIIDGIQGADFRYSNVNRQFGIVVPTDVIDFGNFSTLPPIYTVVSVDTSQCASPCAVGALLKNLGGTAPAVGPSTVTFTMTDPVTGHVLGSCEVTVQPDVGYNATTTVSCTIDTQPTNAAVVTAAPNNPGRG